MQRDGDRARITFVVLDNGIVVDTQKQTVNAGNGTLLVNGTSIDLGSRPTAP